MTPEDIKAILAVLDFSDVQDEIQAEIEAATLAGASDALLGGNIDNSALIATANRNARDYAKERAAELVGRGEQSIADTTREKLRDILTASFEEETEMPDLLEDINNSGIFDEDRAKLIALTEVNRGENFGNLSAYEQMNIDTVDWVNGEEACSECQEYEDNSPYTLKEAAALLDETHPRCRCGLVPHIAEEGEE